MYNGTEDPTHLEHADAPDIHTKTQKLEDFTVLNDISEVDDLLLCEAASLFYSANFLGGNTRT